MTTTLRRYAAAFLACIGFSLPAAATTYSTDYTDLWWVPSENGHGVNIVHQGNTLFVSIYVYGPDLQPHWYFASGMTGNATTFTGALYRASGTPHGAPWNPGQFNFNPVGTITLNFTTDSQATISYTSDTGSVNKTIVRNTFKANDLTGRYLGGVVALSNTCGSPDNNNKRISIANELIVTHSGNPRFVVNFTTVAGAAASCTFTGAYTQEGKLGSIPNGTWSCTGGANNVGTFNMRQIDARVAGINAVVTMQDQYCRYVGYFGGVTDVQ
ncbi:MAG TPA: hypothetical protein VFK48_17605 [Usitatibacter sp.]|nr:hypothetical protein [Usitatibacter sp.]